MAGEVPSATDGAGTYALSPSARAVWAKSGKGSQWLTLPQHLLDSYGVGLALFDNWLAPSVRQRWGSCLPGGVDDARRLFGFICAAHDVGKASPSFVCQVDSLAARGRLAGLPCASLEELRTGRRAQPHSAVSDWAVRGWLQAHGLPAGLSGQIGSILGAHHGRPADEHMVRAVPNRPVGLGGAEWGSVRTELLDWVGRLSGTDLRFSEWTDVSLPLAVQIGMTGLLIMADWVASNQSYFGLHALDAELSPPLAEPVSRWRDGWDAVALPGPWAPALPRETGLALYRSRFGWPDDWRPTALQTYMAQAAVTGDVGLMIAEATMGSGKTEAALVAAEVLAAHRGSQGLLIALPTQATTNAMFDRVLPWLQRQPSPLHSDVPWSIGLGHGKAGLNRRYAEMVALVREVDEGYAIDHLYDQSAGVDGEFSDDTARAIAHQWFNGRKRRLLHNFVVATIDQLLMAGTRTKHQMLNHVALAGKVVVVDEAHASDSYMNVFLDAVLPWLGEYGTPVIILSATLTPERRSSLIDAYCGRPMATPVDESDYPRVTTVNVDRDRAETRACLDDEAPRQVAWHWLEVSDSALTDSLRERMPDDGCALIVRNTVAAAQSTYDLLVAAGLGPVTLTHSRFMAVDRAERDAELLERFGPDSTMANGRRPRRHIVVATQVVEQSLDVDFDLLVTDLAPVDLLFQRIGRLHRHHRVRPQGLGEARVLVLRGDEQQGQPPRGDDGSHAIYGDHLLLRTSAVLTEHGHLLTLPDDIAPLVSRALGSALVGRPDWQLSLVSADAIHRVEEERRRTQALAYALVPPRLSRRVTPPRMSSWCVDFDRPQEEHGVAAMVRDTDPTLEVVLVPLDPDGQVVTPPWLGGEPLDVRTLPDRGTALAISSWIIRLPPSLTRTGEDMEQVIAVLQSQTAVRRWTWSEHPLLKGELFLPMMQTTEGGDVLESNLFGQLKGGFLLRYSPLRGLEVVR